MSEEKKIDRRKYIKYVGAGAAVAAAAAIGYGVSELTRPPPPTPTTVVTTVPAPTTIVTTTVKPTTIVTTVPTVTTVTTAPQFPLPPKTVELINWDKPDWVTRLTGLEIGEIPAHWIERWPFLRTYNVKLGTKAAIKGYELPDGWKKAVEGVKVIKFLNYGGIKHDPATAMGMSAFEDLTGIRVEMEEMEELALWLKTISIMTARSNAIHLLCLNVPTLLQHAAKNGWLVQMDFMWPEKVQKIYAEGIKALKFAGHWFATTAPAPKPMVLYYRPSWLKQATGSSEPPKSYLELLDIGKQVAEWARRKFGPGYYGLALPGKDHRYMMDVMLGPVHSLGGSFIEPETGRVNFLNPAVKATWELFVKYYREGVAPPESLGWSWAEPAEVFGKGNAGLVITGTVDIVRFSNPDLSPGIQGDWEVAEPIGFSEKDPPKTGDISLSTWGVNPYATPQEQAAAFLFADFYRSHQAQWNELVFEGNDTLNIDLYDEPTAKEYGIKMDMKKKWQSVAVTDVFPPGGDDMLVKWLEWFHQAALGKISAEEALKNAQADANKISLKFLFFFLKF